jgi:hypothetical protein
MDRFTMTARGRAVSCDGAVLDRARRPALGAERGVRDPRPAGQGDGLVAADVHVNEPTEDAWVMDYPLNFVLSGRVLLGLAVLAVLGWLVPQQDRVPLAGQTRPRWR